jgi:universal stress protein E
MKQQQTRLFVVIDPTALHQLALVKALLIAKLGDCHIHAFLCIHEEIEKSGVYASRKDFKQKSLVRASAMLEDEMRSCRISEVSYSTEVVWNADWAKTLVRSVRKSNCDLLIKSSYQHSRARRFFSKTSDYYLIHECPCPILFTHQGQEWQSDRVLACLDLESTDAGHARLNKAIVRDAAALVSIMGMDLFIASICETEVNLDDHALRSRYGELAPKQLGKTYDLTEDRVLLRQGNVVETLQAICDEVDPAIVVIGTLARRGIEGKLIGNTAEKLLDVIDADLLTIP